MFLNPDLEDNTRGQIYPYITDSVIFLTPHVTSQRFIPLQDLVTYPPIVRRLLIYICSIVQS